MRKQTYMAAVDATVERWRHDRLGESLTCQTFDAGVPAHCHANAAAYVTSHEGEVVHGFLVLHPQDWTEVMVMAHSVVRTATGLVDVSLSLSQLQGHAFFPLLCDVDDFVEQAQRFPEQRRSIVL